MTESNGLEIAIVGMACHFPGARSVEEFWFNLKEGVETIAFFSDEDLEESGVSPLARKHPAFVGAGGVLEGIDELDAAFFGIPPREAELLDPQQRLFLERCHEALESAGIDPRTFGRPIGVYAGLSRSTYLQYALSHPEIRRDASGLQILMATDKDFLASRVAYKLDLEGPAVVIQTACSTSLVAVHLACQSLLAGECDAALAGGSSIRVPQKTGYLFEEDGIQSRDGHCRAFDARANGTVPGNGVGVVVLKRLSDALEDGDSIDAVIKGSAINNDGARKIGYTAPRIEGEARAIRQALSVAGVAPHTVSAVEAHGTATALGDPIEVKALNQVFARGRRRSCALGSVKSNFGHLDAAAGVAGLIKMASCLKHRTLVPSLHFESANPEIDFDAGPFYVSTETRPWRSEGSPLRAGVSSFGIGGTNAHVVLEEAPATAATAPRSREREILVISARTAEALARASENLASHLERSPEVDLADVAHTLAVGRRGFAHRRALVAADCEEAVTKLRERPAPAAVAPDASRPVAFLFSGQGSQYPGMGRGLYETEPEFRRHLDACSEELTPILGTDLRERLYAGEGDDAASELRETWLTQPALFVVELALARLWMSLGVTPQVMIGHSIGELVAATLAGVFELPDALRVVARRGRAMQEAARGAMLGVALSEEEARDLLRPGLSLAAVNAPAQSVLSGTMEAVEELRRELEERGVETVRLETSHAFHSESMEGAARALEEELAKARLTEPRIPFVSNLTGKLIRSEEATSPSYWARHLRHTVRFADGIGELLREKGRLYLEVGPGTTLTGLLRLSSGWTREGVAVTSLRHPKVTTSDGAHFLEAMAKLWVAGVAVDWKSFRARERRRRLRLPTYPFERGRYWIDPRKRESSKAEGKKTPISEWFYLPSWRRSLPAVLPPPAEMEEGARWLVFRDRDGLGDRLVPRLKERGAKVFAVSPGNDFVACAEEAFEIRPDVASDYERLIEAVGAGSDAPFVVLHLWGVSDADELERSQSEGLESLFGLGKALQNQFPATAHRIIVATTHMQQVTTEGPLRPEKATVLGPCRVLPQEAPLLTCKSVDLTKSDVAAADGRLADVLMAECFDVEDVVVAHRGLDRWVESFERTGGLAASSTRPPLRDGGVYLVTGGLGGIGLAVAEELARAHRAKLVLTSRTGLPPRSKWESSLAETGAGDESGQRIRRVLALEGMGAEVLVAVGDAADPDRMESIFRDAEERFGRVEGIVHAAGIPGSGLVQLATRERTDPVLSPKVRGTLVLDEIARRHGVPFLLLCSSLASILGGKGQADYCGANAFQDAFARSRASRGPTRTIAVDWDTWGEVGMAVAPRLSERQVAEARRVGVSSAEGIEAFRCILGSSANRVLVSSRELTARLAAARKVRREAPAEDVESRCALHPRPPLQNDYVAPRTDLERGLARIWQGVLGIEAIGTTDNFFELGADSVSALKVIQKLNETESTRPPIRLVTVYEAPTVEALAQRLGEDSGARPALEESGSRAESRIAARSRRSRRQAI